MGTYFIGNVIFFCTTITSYEIVLDSLKRRHGISKFKENETRFVLEASLVSSLATVLLLNFMDVIVIRR